MLSSRPVYRRQQLVRVLEPASIAIVGASPRSGSFGERLLANLADYDGEVFLVNAKYPEIQGRRCYPSLLDLPRSPDCVVVATARDAVEPVVLGAADVQAGGVLLFASGYAETGLPERIAQQARLSQIASERNLRILGPNMLGMANYLRRARVTFAEYPAFGSPRHASVGIASQSGALSQSLAQAIERGMSVSHVFAAGNQCDVDVADLVAYLAEDEACRAIACVLEGIPEPQRLLEAAQLAWRADKPLLIHKIATGEQGAAAAMSHTGTLAGSNAAYIAAFERAGAIAVPDFEALMESAAFFAKAPAPKAAGVAVCATSGGAAIIAADKAELHGIPLPQPSDSSMAILKQHIPEFGSARNPCDVTAQVLNNPESLGACGEALMSEASYGALIVPQPVAFDVHVPRIGVFGELARRHGKMTCNVLLSDWLQGPASREAEEHPNVAMFRSMGRCMRTLAAWQHRDELRRREAADSVVRSASSSALRDAAGLIGSAGNPTLTEREAKAVLAAYGIPVVGERLVQSAQDAVAAARELGLPVVLKVESPDLPHKTEAGVIQLNLRSLEEVEHGYAAVMANAAKVQPAARINGVLVQPMVPGGAEVMVGARIDPQFGPLVVVGLGGTLVELLKDTQVALAPVGRAEARSMLERLKGVRVLQGFRGSAPVDVDRLVDIVVRLSELAADQAALVQEIDVNPLICAGDRIVAVDALIVRHLQA